MDSVLGSILKGKGHVTTVATIAGPVAINELLLREGEERSSCNLVETFKGSSSGE